MATWGKEGETYTVENGKRKFKPEFKELGVIRTKTGIATYGAHLVVDMNAFSYLNSDKYNNALKKIQQGNEARVQPRLAFTNEENDILATVLQQWTVHLRNTAMNSWPNLSPDRRVLMNGMPMWRR